MVEAKQAVSDSVAHPDAVLAQSTHSFPAIPAHQGSAPNEVNAMIHRQEAHGVPLSLSSAAGYARMNPAGSRWHPDVGSIPTS